MSDKLVSKLGFYFMVFQRYSGNYAKCYLDNSNEYILYDINDICKMVAQEGDYKLIEEFNQAISTYTPYLWDVENGSIDRITAAPEEKSAVVIQSADNLMKSLGRVKSNDLNEVFIPGSTDISFLSRRR